MKCDCSLGLEACNCCGFTPVGRPLIPGQDATPHEGKDYGWLNWLATVVVLGVAAAAVFA